MRCSLHKVEIQRAATVLEHHCACCQESLLYLFMSTALLISLHQPACRTCRSRLGQCQSKYKIDLIVGKTYSVSTKLPTPQCCMPSHLLLAVLQTQTEQRRGLTWIADSSRVSDGASLQAFAAAKQEQPAAADCCQAMMPPLPTIVAVRKVAFKMLCIHLTRKRQP